MDRERRPAGRPNQSPVLRLQSSIGNRAVSRMLQRDADTAADTATKPPTAPEHPKWFRLDSEQEVLPGVEPILPGQTKPFFATHKGPYTEGDRLALIKALDGRERENRPRQERYIGSFAAKFAAMARDTAIEDMLKAGVEATKASGFWFFVGPILGAAVGMLFPAMGVVEAAVASANISFDMNIVQQLTSGDASETLQAEAQRLMDEDRPIFSGLGHQALQELLEDRPIFSGLEQLLQGLMTEADVAGQYRWWIEEAPLSELGKFRIPPRIADVSDREIGIAAATALSAILNQLSEARSRDEDVTLRVSLTLLAKKRAWLRGKAWVQGPAAIAASLEGARVRSLSTLPLRVELAEEAGTLDPYDALFAFLGLPAAPAVWERTADQKLVADIADAWPTSGPVLVERNPSVADGMPLVTGGNMAGELYLADLARPGTDWMALIRNADDRTRRSNQDDDEREARLGAPWRAANNLARDLLQDRADGAELLLADAVNGLSLDDREREVGWARMADAQQALDQQRAEERRSAEREKLIHSIAFPPLNR